ncbi:MAG TPA: hypothetical protein ENK37_05315 [Oceanithermus profundus]|uniref:Serine protease n=1 Tax=Oceanithermus profundus TaxID=187137 RepID=A0A7C4ZH51_9DEIN|nr:hypothetical protein [Oceanithermus profundus]
MPKFNIRRFTGRPSWATPSLVGVLLVALTLLAGCQPKPQKTLTNKLRPFQSGSLIDVESGGGMIASCSYGFHAQRYGQIGLVTAVHCTDTDFDYDGHFTSTNERIWQSYSDDSNPVARVSLKPNMVYYTDDAACEAVASAYPDFYIRWCLYADATFAPFVDQNKTGDEKFYLAGAVANLPLSKKETKLGPVDETHPNTYTGYGYAPLSDTPIYKIGATTGKTEGELPKNIPEYGNFIAQFPSDPRYFANLGVFFVVSDNTAPLVSSGDSGGGVFHATSYTEDPDGPFALTGITIGEAEYQGETLLVMEPLQDILDTLDVEVEIGGSGALGRPVVREN